MNPISFLVDWRSKHTVLIAGIGLLALAVYDATVGRYHDASQALLAGLASLGLLPVVQSAVQVAPPETKK